MQGREFRCQYTGPSWPEASLPDAVIGFIGSEVTADFESALTELDWRCSWDDSTAGAGVRLMQLLEQKLLLHGDVQLALNLDGFNPVTYGLVPG